jgi:hypothetical protein
MGKEILKEKTIRKDYEQVGLQKAPHLQDLKQNHHSSDILSIRFKHTRIIRFFGLFKKYLKILDTKANFQAFVSL